MSLPLEATESVRKAAPLSRHQGKPSTPSLPASLYLAHSGDAARTEQLGEGDRQYLTLPGTPSGSLFTSFGDRANSCAGVQGIEADNLGPARSLPLAHLLFFSGDLETARPAPDPTSLRPRHSPSAMARLAATARTRRDTRARTTKRGAAGQPRGANL